jgi:NADPH-dependent 2,4-dienoyl-CoA reductase/sulfur reductase-like enzyme
MSTPMKLLIIGGSDAGISAALRARELDPNTNITVLLEDEFPNYSICGLPFYLSGETPDWRSLAHRTEFDGIDVRRGHRAHRIDPEGKTVRAIAQGVNEAAFPYDKLVIGTGAGPVQPKIQGGDLPGVFPLHTMKDSFAVHAYLEGAKPRRAVIVGAGYIGLEMADALTHRGIEVTVASRTPTVLATVDADFGDIVADELRKHGVRVNTDVEARSILQTEDGLHISGSNGFEQDCEMVLIAVGVKPHTAVGVEAGLKVGAKGAFLTNRHMESSISDIYVAGDCGETWHRLLNRYTYLPLGTTAHKQGRVAGENALGGNREFAGSLGTQVVKIFDLVIARTGLRQDEAEREGLSAATVLSTANDHKAYYPGTTPLHFRVTGDRDTGRLLGAQMLGRWGAEISKRVDIFASALFQGMTVDQVCDLDLSYTPPLSSPWDPVQIACQAWSAKVLNDSRRTNV